ncbi:deoxyuridine triphosphatase [Microbacterium phage Eden]|uniref:Deoxyuridine triphosphatase n=1 Tax=Microbacterium phage Eden TaxID=2250289 RepID=A0A345KWC1_9CAUD|nr:dUTPase [Microbacterium phage Eden]AXH47323.1 deoxyuridine triphosphatase [Microbacterium phage Eden]
MPEQPDALAQLLQAQEDLQIEAYGSSPALLLPDNVVGAVDFIHWNVTALTDELHELLGETSWKPWAKGDYVNLTAAKGEAIDALHFLLNLFNVLGMDSEEVQERYYAKRKKNIKRQEDGYDGRSTKCPGCKRALDDDGVTCHPFRGRLGTDEVEDLIFCDRHGRAYRPNKETT